MQVANNQSREELRSSTNHSLNNQKLASISTRIVARIIDGMVSQLIIGLY